MHLIVLILSHIIFFDLVVSYVISLCPTQSAREAIRTASHSPAFDADGSRHMGDCSSGSVLHGAARSEVQKQLNCVYLIKKKNHIGPPHTFGVSPEILP